jgi:hypothetical protein
MPWTTFSTTKNFVLPQCHGYAAFCPTTAKVGFRLWACEPFSEQRPRRALPSDPYQDYPWRPRFGARLQDRREGRYYLSAHSSVDDLGLRGARWPVTGGLGFRLGRGSAILPHPTTVHCALLDRRDPEAALQGEGKAWPGGCHGAAPALLGTGQVRPWRCPLSLN